MLPGIASSCHGVLSSPMQAFTLHPRSIQIHAQETRTFSLLSVKSTPACCNEHGGALRVLQYNLPWLTASASSGGHEPVIVCLRSSGAGVAIKTLDCQHVRLFAWRIDLPNTPAAMDCCCSSKSCSPLCCLSLPSPPPVLTLQHWTSTSQTNTRLTPAYSKAKGLVGTCRWTFYPRVS